LSDCEELVGVTHRRWCEWTGVCSDFFLQSIPQAATEGLFRVDKVNELQRDLREMMRLVEP